MTYNKLDIIQALRVIKTTCEESISCSKCPFYCNRTMDCAFATPPKYTKINEELPATWRAVK